MIKKSNPCTGDFISWALTCNPSEVPRKEVRKLFHKTMQTQRPICCVVCRWVVSHRSPIPLLMRNKGLPEALWEGYGSYPPLNYPPAHGLCYWFVALVLYTFSLLVLVLMCCYDYS